MEKGALSGAFRFCMTFIQAQLGDRLARQPAKKILNGGLLRSRQSRILQQSTQFICGGRVISRVDCVYRRTDHLIGWNVRCTERSDQRARVVRRATTGRSGWRRARRRSARCSVTCRRGSARSLLCRLTTRDKQRHCNGECTGQQFGGFHIPCGFLRSLITPAASNVNQLGQESMLKTVNKQ